MSVAEESLLCIYIVCVWYEFAQTHESDVGRGDKFFGEHDSRRLVVSRQFGHWSRHSSQRGHL